jgi:NAD(P)-dependent dehydrogenase (short-subunit alcohol dehydrogenase family)
MDEAGQVALVTGAASGIGLATALAFADQSVRVVLVDRDAHGCERALDAVRDRGGDGVAQVCDVTDGASVQEAVDAAVELGGRLDFAVNAAGVEGATLPILDEDEELYDRVMGVNVRGVWLCLRAQIRQMTSQQPGGGAIVNISSGAGLVGSKRCASYSASTHAVIGLSKSAALQYARSGVRVNAICPAGVATPMADRIVGTFAGAPPSKGGAAYPLGRYSTPEEIASAALWLCSPGAASAIGTVLAVDGGFVAT